MISFRTALAAIVISAALLPAAASAAPSQGTLLKLACPANAEATHSCRAVYFYGHDNKRHAFTNARVYASWYADFSGVRTVSSAELAAIPLGSNVTYRPGSKLVKFQTDPKTYAVALGGELRWVTSEAAASGLYGAGWNTGADDISDASYLDYRFGSSVASVADFSVSAERTAAPTPDDNLPATYRAVSVATANGTFSVQMVKLMENRFRMITDAAETSDCADGCPSAPLLDFAQRNGALIGMDGVYACPPDYAACAGKTNSFLWPFFDSPSRTMLNSSSLAVHKGPMLTQDANGAYRYYHRSADFGNVSSFEASHATTLQAGFAHYPSLLESGAVVVNDEPMLEDGMKTVKAGRGGIGLDGRFVYLLLVKSATVLDLAQVFVALGAKDAMNLDGGGSSAMIFDGKYVAGPGRALTNGILFVGR
ncbi:MAG: hypothetical protein RLZZ324_587 [Candidatus Parcubacteria bacterium]|jgi:hypothetical protein